MPGFQDLAVRLAELLDIPESQAIAFTNAAIPVFTIESIVGLPSTRVSGLVGTPSFGTQESGAVAAVRSHTQLFNPVDSGVVLHVDHVTVSANALTGSQIRRFDTALATLGTSFGFADFQMNGLPAAQLRDETFAAAQGQLLLSYLLAANEPRDVNFVDAVVLPEGTGILSAAVTVNVALRATWSWREVR